MEYIPKAERAIKERREDLAPDWNDRGLNLITGYSVREDEGGYSREDRYSRYGEDAPVGFDHEDHVEDFDLMLIKKFGYEDNN